MLSFRLRLTGLGRDRWRWDTDRWTSGESWIKPFAHPALERSLVHNGAQGACVVVRESAVVRESHAEGEFIRVELRPGRVRITAGLHGTAPVYLTAAGDLLEGSWYLPDLRHACTAGRLLDRAVVRALTRRHRYSSDTLFTGVHRLTERATATFTPEGLRIDYPPPALHVARARRLRPGVDPVEAFDGLLADIVARYAVPSAGVELSGGVDSANVALTVAALHREAGSYGLLFDGELGEQQQRRRDTLARRLGLRDVTVPAADWPPFTPGGCRASGVPHDPCGDFYLEAFQAAVDRAATLGVRVVFTGMGGDEIMALRLTERDTPLSEPGKVPWLGARARDALVEVDHNLAPVSPAPLPSLLVFAARNPTFLRSGVWPVSPLADPLLVRFGESLPVQWRRRKRLLRERLRRAGFPEEVADPPRPENFTALMQAGLRRHGLPLLERMLDDSILVDAGYVDRVALAAAHQRATAAEEVPDPLYDTIALEVGLRSLLEKGNDGQ
ncbi:asparagine synthase [Carbonactinospora thermoautotrophica]|uniref:asparagine synthase-related protein n=1 Tax=Carbonactinospora thermoautotrophica TaxID=1469144 RepID=UPI002271BDAD|nr:asparagine synthase-related protein [Carbonactinospora thermoautotrophica]MCX9192960.1 asparagine synthase [Carbonactinospora thermoautotrophica]